MTIVGRAIGRWLHCPDNFEWLTPYFASRGLTRPIRLVMGTVALSLALIPVEATVSAARPSWPVVAVSWLMGAGGVIAGYLWFTRWPTRSQSIVLGFSGSLTVAGWSVGQPDPNLALLACTSLAVSGAYFALLHSPRYVVVNVAVATATALYATWRLWDDSDALHAIVSLWLVLALNLLVPSAVQLVVGAFATDLPLADRDPLTGLLNRRGLDAHTAAVLADNLATSFIHTMVIDLDDFKRVNDTYGHSAGDDVLRAVAQVLYEHTRTTALRCRTGGEEFLVVDVTASTEPPPHARPILEHIAALPVGVTASIGTAVGTAGSARRSVAHIVAVADQLMYEAKRSGGNQVRHADTLVPVPDR